MKKLAKLNYKFTVSLLRKLAGIKEPAGLAPKPKTNRLKGSIKTYNHLYK